MSKAKLKDQIIYLENKLANKENELQKTLKSFDEIRDELTYYKGFHDGVKNGAKVNFSPTINQQPKKEFPSGGIVGNHKEVKEDGREFCKPLEPRSETIEKVLKFSEEMKTENKEKPKFEGVLNDFLNSDKKGISFILISSDEISADKISEIIADEKKEQKNNEPNEEIVK